MTEHQRILNFTKHPAKQNSLCKHTGIMRVFLIGAICTLSGCAISPRKPMTMQARQRIHSNKILINSAQKSINILITSWASSNFASPYSREYSGAIMRPNTSEAPGGLLQDLIASGLTSHDDTKASKMAQPVRKALGHYKYLNDLEKAIQQKVATIPWLKVKKVATQYAIKKSEKDVINAAKENTTLLIGTTYRLSEQFNRLEVATWVQLDEKQPKNQTPSVLYSNQFNYYYFLESASSNHATNKARWVQDHAAFLKKQLSRAASATANMVAMDLQNPQTAPYANNKKAKANIICQGRLIKKTGKLYYILMNGGSGKICASNIPTKAKTA